MKTGLKALWVALMLSWLPTVGFAMKGGTAGGPSWQTSHGFVEVAMDDSTDSEDEEFDNARPCDEENITPNGGSYRKANRGKRHSNRRSCRGGKRAQAKKAHKRQLEIDAALDSKDVQQLMDVIGKLQFEQLAQYVDSLENITLRDGSNGKGTFLHALVWRGSTEQLKKFLSMPLFKSNALYWLTTSDRYSLTPHVYAQLWQEKVALLEAARECVREPLLTASPQHNKQGNKHNGTSDCTNVKPRALENSYAVSSCSTSTAVPVASSETAVHSQRKCPSLVIINNALNSRNDGTLWNALNRCSLEELKRYSDGNVDKNVLGDDGNIYFQAAPRGSFMHALVRRGTPAQLMKFLYHPLFHQDAQYWLTTGDTHGSPPLQYAANFNKTEIVRLLVEAGASVRHVDGKTGRSLFQYAMVHNNDEMFDILMHGRDFSSDLLDIPDKEYHFPPIDYAVVNGRDIMVMQLRAGGANFLWKDQQKRSLLHLAITKAKDRENPGQLGDYSMLKLLLQTECRLLIDEPDSRGFTPLEAALCAKRSDLVELLLDEGADVEFCLKETNENYLHRAVYHNCCEGLLLILERACLCGDGMKTLYELFEQKNSNGETPLERAVKNGLVGAAKLLKNFGAGTRWQAPQAVASSFNDSILTGLKELKIGFSAEYQ